MISFKQYLTESKIMRTYHGAQREWDWNEDELPRNKFQRRFFSSNRSDEAKRYGPVVHVQDVDTSEYKHVNGDTNSRKIDGAIRKKYKGIVFHNAADKDAVIPKHHTEVVTFDHKTVKKIGYLGKEKNKNGI